MNDRTDFGISARIKKVADDVGSLTKLAEKTGIPLTTLAMYARGATEPKPSAIYRISQACGLDPLWIFAGSPTENGGAAHRDSVKIPLFPVVASAGPGQIVGDDEMARKSIFLPRDMLPPAPINCLQALYARGDSMWPVIHDGDLLVLDTAPVSRIGEGIYVLRYGDDSLRVKCLEWRADGDLTIRALAGTDMPERVPPSRIQDLSLIGRVIWRAGKI